MGSPMSHSTHVGFSSPPSLPFFLITAGPEPFQSLAVAVGYRRTVVARPSPLVELTPLRL